MASPMLAAAPANAGDYADALARMLDRAGVEQTILVGHSLGALVAAAFAAKYPQRVLYGARRRRAGLRRRKPHSGKSLAGASTADSAGRRGDGPGRAAKLLRHAREADVATVAAGCAGYAATVISPRHGCWPMTTFTVGSPTIAVVSPCGVASRMPLPNRVSAGSGAALRRPYIAIPQAGHASYLDNEIFLINSFYA